MEAMPATMAAGIRPRHMPGIALKVADGQTVPWRIHVRARMDHTAVAIAIRVNVAAHLKDRPVTVVRPCSAMANRTATGVAAMPVIKSLPANDVHVPLGVGTDCGNGVREARTGGSRPV